MFAVLHILSILREKLQVLFLPLPMRCLKKVTCTHKAITWEQVSMGLLILCICHSNSVQFFAIKLLSVLLFLQWFYYKPDLVWHLSSNYLTNPCYRHGNQFIIFFFKSYIIYFSVLCMSKLYSIINQFI